jgi:hypothetical protein
MNRMKNGRGARRTYDDAGVCFQPEPGVVSCRAGRKKAAANLACRVMSRRMDDAVQHGRPEAGILSLCGADGEREGGRATRPCLFGSPDRLRLRADVPFLAKIHGFFLSLARPKHVTRDEVTSRARVPNRSGAGRRCRPGSAKQSVCSGSAGRSSAGRRVTQADYAGSDARGMAMWWHRSSLRCAAAGPDYLVANARVRCSDQVEFGCDNSRE